MTDKRTPPNPGVPSKARAPRPTPQPPGHELDVKPDRLGEIIVGLVMLGATVAMMVVGTVGLIRFVEWAL